MTSARRLPSLDGVRGLAVAMVLVFHVGQVWEDDKHSWFAQRVFELTAYGSLGVDLFFVLSGFLITGILLESRGETGYYRSFYARRVLRIFPLYYAYLALLGLIVLFVPAARESYARSWPWYALYLTNVKIVFFNDGDLGSVQHLWSLAVEEHFYLLWPAVVASLPRRMLLGFVSFTIALVAAGRWLWLAHGGESIEIHMSTWTRIDTLLIGAALAILRTDETRWRQVTRAAPLVVPLALVCVVVPRVAWPSVLEAEPVLLTFGYTATSVLFAALLASCISAEERGEPVRVLCSREVRRLGTLSYGIYVLHFILVLRFGGMLKGAAGSGLLGFAVSLALIGGASYGLAALSYAYLESPALRLKRLFPRPAALGTPAQAGEPQLIARGLAHSADGSDRVRASDVD